MFYLWESFQQHEVHFMVAGLHYCSNNPQSLFILERQTLIIHVLMYSCYEKTCLQETAQRWLIAAQSATSSPDEEDGLLRMWLVVIHLRLVRAMESTDCGVKFKQNIQLTVLSVSHKTVSSYYLQKLSNFLFSHKAIQNSENSTQTFCAFRGFRVLRHLFLMGQFLLWGTIMK